MILIHSHRYTLLLQLRTVLFWPGFLLSNIRDVISNKIFRQLGRSGFNLLRYLEGDAWRLFARGLLEKLRSRVFIHIHTSRFLQLRTVLFWPGLRSHNRD